MVFGLTQISLFVVLAHTDPTDLTELHCGWEISRRLVDLFDSGPHTDLTDLTGFLCGWEISRISVNEDKGMFFYFLLYNLLLISLIAVHYSVIAVFKIFFVEINQVADS